MRWTSQLADLVEIRRRDDANDGRAALSGSGQTRRISWDLSELVISPAGPDRWADVEFPDDGNSRTSGSVHGADDGMNSSIRDPPPPSSASSVSSRRSSGSVSSAASNASSAASEDDYADDERNLIPSDDMAAASDDDSDEDEDEEDEESADEWPARLICVRGGAASDATLRLLRETLEEAFGVKPQTQRLVLTRGDNDTVPPELIAAAAGEDDTACPSHGSI